MARLILQFENRVLKEVGIGASATIGRLPDNTLVIDNPAVSSRHARITRDGDHFILEDLQSTNGTYINQTRVTRHTLADGDVALIGKHKIVFEAAGGDEEVVDAPEPAMAAIEGTMFLDTRRQKELLAQAKAIHAASEAPTSKVAVTSTAPPAKPAGSNGAANGKTGVLTVLSGDTDQSEYLLRAQTSLIGKSEGAVVRLKGWFKPKSAVAIARKGETYTATQLGGKTLINGQPLSGRQDLNEGDVLSVSGLTLEFRLK
jgi:pSer/pThr/pTyr-binding forkhead associated (FHA) protein